MWRCGWDLDFRKGSGHPPSTAGIVAATRWEPCESAKSKDNSGHGTNFPAFREDPRSRTPKSFHYTTFGSFVGTLKRDLRTRLSPPRGLSETLKP